MAISLRTSRRNGEVATCNAAAPRFLHRVDMNMNPSTGLATDYLNHFNEAIMLLEMLREMPECLDDFLAWQPMSYREHFLASKFKDRDLAIAAYNAADPVLRERLDGFAKAMNEILLATHDVMRHGVQTPTAVRIADLAVSWLKPLVARAGAVINGNAPAQSAARPATMPQAAVDALLAR
jgi:hypothetical protein